MCGIGRVAIDAHAKLQWRSKKRRTVSSKPIVGELRIVIQGIADVMLRLELHSASMAANEAEMQSVMQKMRSKHDGDVKAPNVPWRCFVFSAL